VARRIGGWRGVESEVDLQGFSACVKATLTRTAKSFFAPAVTLWQWSKTC
jgi:hypothetical protein